jgi:hypothetical protein
MRCHKLQIRQLPEDSQQIYGLVGLHFQSMLTKQGPLWITAEPKHAAVLKHENYRIPPLN